MSNEDMMLNINLPFIGRQIAEQTFEDGEGAAKLADYLAGASQAISFAAHQNGLVTQSGQAAAIAQLISDAGLERWKELTLGKILMEREAGGNA